MAQRFEVSSVIASNLKKFAKRLVPRRRTKKPPYQRNFKWLGKSKQRPQPKIESFSNESLSGDDATVPFGEATPPFDDASVTPHDVKFDSPEDLMEGGIILNFERTSSGPVWTLPSRVSHDERIPESVLQEEFLYVFNDGTDDVPVRLEVDIRQRWQE